MEYEIKEQKADTRAKRNVEVMNTLNRDISGVRF